VAAVSATLSIQAASASTATRSTLRSTSAVVRSAHVAFGSIRAGSRL
jgi:hypothetical protein